MIPVRNLRLRVVELVVLVVVKPRIDSFLVVVPREQPYRLNRHRVITVPHLNLKRRHLSQCGRSTMMRLRLVQVQIGAVVAEGVGRS